MHGEWGKGATRVEGGVGMDAGGYAVDEGWRGNDLSFESHCGVEMR